MKTVVRAVQFGKLAFGESHNCPGCDQFISQSSERVVVSYYDDDGTWLRQEVAHRRCISKDVEVLPPRTLTQPKPPSSPVQCPDCGRGMKPGYISSHRGSALCRRQANGQFACHCGERFLTATARDIHEAARHPAAQAATA